MEAQAIDMPSLLDAFASRLEEAGAETGDARVTALAQATRWNGTGKTDDGEKLTGRTYKQIRAALHDWEVLEGAESEREVVAQRLPDTYLTRDQADAVAEACRHRIAMTEGLLGTLRDHNEIVLGRALEQAEHLLSGRDAKVPPLSPEAVSEARTRLDQAQQLDRVLLEGLGLKTRRKRERCQECNLVRDADVKCTRCGAEPIEEAHKHKVADEIDALAQEIASTQQEIEQLLKDGKQSERVQALKAKLAQLIERGKKVAPDTFKDVKTGDKAVLKEAAGERLSARGGARLKVGEPAPVSPANSANFERLHPRGRGGKWIQKGDGKPDAPDENVGFLQDRLHQLGFQTSDPHGQFSDSTDTAVKGFQAKYGLPATGKIDETTAEMLRNPPPKTAAEVKAEMAPKKTGSKAAAKKAAAAKKKLEEDLNAVGYESGGAETAKALRMLQKRYGLSVTGKPDTPTLSLIDRLMRKQSGSTGSGSGGSSKGDALSVDQQAVATTEDAEEGTMDVLQEGLNRWDPKLHPRDRTGKWRDVLGKLGIGEKATFTIRGGKHGGTTIHVTRTNKGFHYGNPDVHSQTPEEAAGHVDKFLAGPKGTREGVTHVEVAAKKLSERDTQDNPDFRKSVPEAVTRVAKLWDGEVVSSFDHEGRNVSVIKLPPEHGVNGANFLTLVDGQRTHHWRTKQEAIDYGKSPEAAALVADRTEFNRKSDSGGLPDPSTFSSMSMADLSKVTDQAIKHGTPSYRKSLTDELKKREGSHKGPEIELERPVKQYTDGDLRILRDELKAKTNPSFREDHFTAGVPGESPATAYATGKLPKSKKELDWAIGGEVGQRLRDHAEGKSSSARIEKARGEKSGGAGNLSDAAALGKLLDQAVEGRDISVSEEFTVRRMIGDRYRVKSNKTGAWGPELRKDQAERLLSKELKLNQREPTINAGARELDKRREGGASVSDKVQRAQLDQLPENIVYLYPSSSVGQRMHYADLRGQAMSAHGTPRFEEKLRAAKDALNAIKDKQPRKPLGGASGVEKTKLRVYEREVAQSEERLRAAEKTGDEMKIKLARQALGADKRNLAELRSKQLKEASFSDNAAQSYGGIVPLLGNGSVLAQVGPPNLRDHTSFPACESCVFYGGISCALYQAKVKRENLCDSWYTLTPAAEQMAASTVMAALDGLDEAKGSGGSKVSVAAATVRGARELLEGKIDESSPEFQAKVKKFTDNGMPVETAKKIARKQLASKRVDEARRGLIGHDLGEAERGELKVRCPECDQIRPVAWRICECGQDLSSMSGIAKLDETIAMTEAEYGQDDEGSYWMTSEFAATLED